MRIAVYSENILGNSGGAEIFALKMAEILNKDFDVEIITIENKVNNKKPIEIFEKYGIQCLPVKKIYFQHKKNKLIEILNRISFWFKLKRIVDKKYDVYINTSHNRMLGFKRIRSIHLIHFPVENYLSFLPKFSGQLMNKLYQKSYSDFFTNSSFTNYHLKRVWGVSGKILYPPIIMEELKSDEIKAKEKQIIVVGRLVPDKKILEMVDAFKQLNKQLALPVKLVIIGNRDTNFDGYYNNLINSLDSDIFLYSDLSYLELIEQYKKSSIFWHAKGFGVSEDNPSEMEHFGMTTVEAMANGCVPIVINKAGQKEIIDSNSYGFLWNSIDELIMYTKNLLLNEDLLRHYQEVSINRARYFLIPEFTQRLLNLING